MKKIFFAVIVLLSVIDLYGQKERDFFAFVNDDSLAIFLLQPVGSNESYNVYRKEAGVDKEYILLTKDAPVKPVLDAFEAKVRLGADYDFIAKALDADNETIVLRGIRRNGFKASLLCLISPKAAIISGRMFVDENIKLGKKYSYKLVFLNADGVKKDSVIKDIFAKKITPAPPSNLAFETGNKSITLNWEYPAWKGDFTDVAFRYNVYRKIGKGKFEKVNKNIIIRNDKAVPEFKDIWLKEGEEYSYYVTILDPIGNESKPSNQVRVILEDKIPPAIILGVRTEPYSNGVVLTWNMSAELDAAGYNIYRSTGLSKKFKKITSETIPVDKPAFLDSTASASVQYFYSVTALDTAGNESKRSNPIEGYLKDTTPPEAPGDVTFEIENNIVKLNWKKSSSEDIKGYFVYRGHSEEKTMRITPLTIAETAYADSGYKKTGFPYGGSFIYKISAVDSAGNESGKISVPVKVPDEEPPLIPSNFNLINKKGLYVEVLVSSSPSLDAEKYLIFKSEPGKKNNLLTKSNEAPFSFRDTSVVKGKTYVYSVVVVDTAGNKSEPTADTLFFKDSVPPPAPRNAIAKLINGKVELKWGRSIDFDLAGYNVYRSDHPTGTFVKLNDKPIAETKYIDATGSGKNYYRIRAVDTSGNESKFHKTVSANKN
ncbi:MAG: hypothetical protein GXO87_03500 [Chlorobi bacterium]|nr:hypothetical protein [Chlorobiota bacterium]